MGAKHFLPGSSSQISAVIVSTSRLFRDALATALHRFDEIAPIESIDGGAEALQTARKSEVDVFLLDLSCRDPRALVRRIRSIFPRCPVIALVSNTRPDLVGLAEAGFAGVVDHDDSLEEVCRALLQATKGELECSPLQAAAMAKRLWVMAQMNGCSFGGNPLTAREHEIAALLELGASNKQIAASLSISIATVKNHVHSILEKTGSRRRSEATAKLASRLPCSSGSRRIAPSVVRPLISSLDRK